MTKAILITPSYPRADRLYDSAFIHSRVLGYRGAGLDVEIAIARRNEFEEPYDFEGVRVSTVRASNLEGFLRSRRPDLVLVHFLQREWMKALSAIGRVCRVVIWVHGTEALGWHRRLFNFEPSRAFLSQACSNTLQLVALHRFVLGCEAIDATFVFISEWMKRVMETDARVKVANYAIIANPIDTELFKYEPKPDPMRSRILLIRSFDSRKYANDIAVAAIAELRRFAAFGDLEFTIIGRGRDFHPLTDDIARLPNVRIEERFLNHGEIKREHDAHGLFLCPTRQDSQGVSMCEAMSSGLVPLTSRSTAIPEFVRDGETGFLTTDHRDLARRVLELHARPDLFARMSRAAAESISKKCAASRVIARELEVILRRPNRTEASQA